MARIGNSELDVFPLSLGGNVFGWTADEEQSFAVLDAYAAGGGNFVDSADLYGGGGGSEEILGRWLASRGRPDGFVLATKVGLHADFKGLKPDNIRKAAEASLRRLGTDHIDLYYTHSDDLDVPVEDIITTLDALVKEGKVGTIGASNISPERLAASLDFSEREGLARYEIVQPHYNLVEREHYEGALADLVDARGLSAAPYFALALGFLTGKYRPGGDAVDSVRAGRAAEYLKQERGLKVLAALDQVAAAHDAEVATVALAWLAAQPTVVAPIASARTVEQLPALLAVADLKLTAEELATLTEAAA